MLFRSMVRSMSTSRATSDSKVPLLAVLQLRNFEAASELIRRAHQRGACMAFLPEAFDFMEECAEETKRLAECIDGDIISRYRQLAKDTGMMLSLGGFHEKVSNSDLLRNTHVLLGMDGSILQTYSKCHLFNAEVPGKFKLRESNYIQPGDRFAEPIETPIHGLKVGLGICYDLRFPEFSLLQARSGADILTYPSAFTVPTGMAHWEPLLRTRAIETQCYVVAAAQFGKHNSKRSSYGHAMVIDPWGMVLAQCNDGEGIAFAEIHADRLNSIRLNMPVHDHRRPDLYSLSRTISFQNVKVDDTAVHPFGQTANIPGSCVVIETEHCIVSVNKKPVLPGHLLVIPKRMVHRLTDLRHHELANFAEALRLAQSVTERHHKANSSTVSIQDGPEAGQTIAHLHAHVLPRKKGDFAENDQVYRELESHDKNVQPGEWRTQEAMEEEAQLLRKTIKEFQ